MRHLGFFWGICGVIGILVFAIYRISPYILDMLTYSLNPLHSSVLVVFVLYMAYAEGYKGFHRGFAPRVVVRANYLRSSDKPLLTVFAPLFCMGFFYATRKRVITSCAVTATIILLVLMVRLMPQPWRGIIDSGVAVGLVLGIGSIVFFTMRILTEPASLSCSPDLPSDQPD